MNSTTYSPGLHKLVTLRVDQIEKLTDSQAFIATTELILQKYQLEKVGIVAHSFDNNSFTIAVCLMESHICIHTWPEFSQLTLDVYLCNYLQDNSEKVREVTAEFVRYFEATIVKDFEINR